MKTICIIFFSCLIVFNLEAQQQPASLKAGDAAPSIAGIEKWLSGTPVTQFEKGKVYLMEFGATWCSPCTAAIPELTAIAKKYESRGVTVVSSFVQENYTDHDASGNLIYGKNVERFIKKHESKIHYNIALGSKDGSLNSSWIVASGRAGVPYSFVVDKTGHIAYIGGLPGADSMIAVVLKDDYKAAVDGAKQSSADVIGKINLPKDILYCSVISKFDPEGAPFDNSPFVDNYRYARAGEATEDLLKRRGKLQFRNVTLRRLYYAAYGDTLSNEPYTRNTVTHLFMDTVLLPHQKRSYGAYWYKPVFEVRDSSGFEHIRQSPKNRYDYFFQAPLEKASSKFLQGGLRKDLELYFDYEASVENRMMPCWNITISPKGKQLLQSAEGGIFNQYRDDLGDWAYRNAEMRDVVALLESGFGQSNHLDLVDRPNLQPSFFDATGIKTKIGFTLDGELMDHIFSRHDDPATFNRFVAELEKYGLKLTKGWRMMKVVVIRDRKH